MVHGEHILYHYIQKTLLNNGNTKDAFSQELIERLILDLAIWLPQDFYVQMPHLLPYVFRYSSCRKKRPGQKKDEWGTANSRGFLRDDNSLIKGIIKPLKIKGNRISDYEDKKLGNGFVACHVWRTLSKSNRSASEHEITNTFVPNLVWLPKQIAKLTDREGSYAQKLLQTLSYEIYRPATKNSNLKKDVWSNLNNPKVKTQSILDISKFNYFKTTEKWVHNKKINLQSDIEEIKLTLKNKSISGRRDVKCSAYLKSLISNISKNETKHFLNWLERDYLN